MAKDFQQILLSLIEKYQSMSGADINEVIAATQKSINFIFIELL